MFDIREAINEIIEIQEDKINMKAITLTTKFEGFEDNYDVTTDSKRI